MLGLLFNKTTATGVLHFSSTQDPPNTDEECELDEPYLNAGIHVDVENDSRGQEHTTHHGKRPMHLERSKPKKSAKEGNKFSERTDSILNLTESSKTRLDARSAKASDSEEFGESVFIGDKFSLEKGIKILNQYEDMDNATFFKVLKVIYNLNDRIAFITMPDNRRKDWMDHIANEC